MENHEQKDLEQKAYQFSALDARLRELEQGLTLIERQINELQACHSALDKLAGSKPGVEMLAPLGPGIFANAILGNNKDVLIDMGAKMLCKKSIAEAKQILKQRIDKAMIVHESLSNELQRIVQEMTKMEEELRFR
jgi:prefoldin alpha subunit